jgi:DNA-binding transcriptional MerR regulator
MAPLGMKVGVLARQTGISVRALHYYDEIELLSPSRRTDAGHRLYTAGDIVRLQQIRSLQQLGLSLEEIRACLMCGELSARQVIEQHLAQVRA